MEQTNNLTYNEYCGILDEFVVLDESGILNESLLDKITGIRGKIGKLLFSVKGELANIMKETQIPMKALIKAFKDRDMFAVLEHFGFSILGMIKSVQVGAFAIKKGYAKLAKELLKNGVLRKLQKGTMKVDEVLDKYPLLKKLSAPMIVGLLILIWLNISFISNWDYDMDVSSMFAALKGSYSITDILASPDGIASLLLVFTNIASGGVLSVVWTGSTPINFTLALVYTALKKTGVNQTALSKFKQYIKGNKKMKKTFKEWRNSEQNRQEILDEALLATAMSALKKLIGKVSKSADKIALQRIHSAEADIGLVKNKDKMILMQALDTYDVANKELQAMKKMYLKEGFMMNEESYFPAESAAIGVFEEKSHGKRFELYPLMKNDSWAKKIKATHMIHVGTRVFSRQYLRYVKLKKTVVYVAVDEDGSASDGTKWEKWSIKKLGKYQNNWDQFQDTPQYIVNPIP